METAGSRLKQTAESIQVTDKLKEKFQEMVLFVFALVTLLHLILEIIKSEFCIYSKSLLVPVLIIYSLGNGIDIPFLSALIFAWIGDVFLYWDTVELNFSIGLGSFLLMQLLYTIVFYRLPATSNSYFTQHPGSKAIIIGLYASLYLSINYLISDTAIKGNMQVLIAVYSLAICSMSISALNSSSKCKYIGFNLFIGTLFFIISDGFIALTKFKIIILDKSIAQVIIMSTYCLAQGTIVHAYTYMTNSITSKKKVK